ncbi:ATP-dependent helicase, partial [Patescibacteria group bacterium]|nr:ATP-dependent helicase [Patescibacteria group bacterium]MCG2762146.1 ATP-dependent helicase [Candidatus Atribacteria bacterium]
TDMGRISGKSGANSIKLDDFNWGAYDLIVIDESHNFRGNPLETTSDDGTVKMNRAKWLMDKVIKSGVKTRVLMLSATPVNNTLKDLRNQIALITEGENNALQLTAGIKNIASTLETAQKRFTNWADPKKNPSRNLKQLLEKLDSGFFKLLDELTIARSRKHIKSFYKIKAIDFPNRFKPISLYPVIDRENKFPTYDELNKEILKYKLSVFNPSAYIKPEMKEDYKKKAESSGVSAFTQSDREYFLIGMMKVNYLKRLESSIESFEISIERTIKKIEALENKINNFLKNKTNKDEAIIEFSEPTEVEENEDESDELQVGKKLKFKLADLKLKEWLNALKKDKDALTSLYNNAKLVTPDRDAKLHELKELIRKKIKKPINNENKKVVIFTAFADTAEYLYKNLNKWVQTELKLNSALICGSHTETIFGKKDYDSILTNFSPISKNRSKLMTAPQEGEIDILIATDCISEGQNLQDCDYLVNYDIHWNPVRIIQRFGRIDRLGSINKTVQLVNFWPTHDLDNYLNLKQRVEARMALVDVTATADDNLLTTDQIEELISDELKYRNKQLKKLREEVIDIEEMEESISLTDFTLDDFRVELSNYIENNKQRLENAPLGLYAIVPSPSGKYAKLNNTHDFTATEKEIIKPGIIYCLKQKGDTHGSEEVNPLQPYFLVYIRDDGTVRYNYVNAKQILEIFRLLCQGNDKPYEKLCELFNKETNNGEKMDKYASLLKKAVTEIAHVFKKRSAHRLTNNRSALVIPKKNQVKDMESFELITWLVVR